MTVAIGTPDHEVDAEPPARSSPDHGPTREADASVLTPHTREAADADDRPSVFARALLGLIALYRWTAVVRAPRCRFSPTCSTYAAESIRTHGAGRGSWLALHRIGRCHPWNPGGVDHVPPRK